MGSDPGARPAGWQPAPALRVYVDADVLFAGAASTTGASHDLLLLGELGLIAAMTAPQAIDEARRNLAAKAVRALPAFDRIVERSIYLAPTPSVAAVAALAGQAHPEDLPHLAAALEAGCRWLVTFNVGHFQPGHPTVAVVTPGTLVQRARTHLLGLPRPSR
ncbi:MAG: PIN domain-containing protein [Chloroflexi bacterium]|nr:PIN domain-containing protein [Chloroflexota bacterium]